MKKHTLIIRLNIWVDGNNAQVKDFAEKIAKSITPNEKDANPEIVYLGETSQNGFENRDIINKLN